MSTPVKEVEALSVESLTKGAMFSVTTGTGNTRGSKYLFVVTNPERSNIAVFTKSACIPDRYGLCRLMGSKSDSGLVSGAIAVGSVMYMRDNGDVSGGIIQTRPITGIWMLRSEAWREAWYADFVIRKAEKCFAATVDGIIKKEFPDDRYSRISEMIRLFGNPGGKSAALSALLRAMNTNTAGNKLGVALETMQEYWHRFWEPEYPDIAGDPITALNESRWSAFDIDRDIKAKELLSGHVLVQAETA